MPTEIAMPFRLDGNGRVVTVTDPDAQVRQHVAALANTHPEERPMVTYGTDLTPLIFSDMEPDEVAQQVSLRLRASAQVHEPGIEILGVQAEPVEGDDVGAQKVSLDYRRLDAPDSSSVANANQAVIGVNGVVREIVRG